MSTPPYLTLISEVLPVQRRDFPLMDTALLNPNNANPLLDGEWLTLDSTEYKLERGSGAQVTPAWQLFAEKGRYDTQSIGKVPVLFMGGYEAESKIVNLSGLALGDALVVNDVTVVTTKRGLLKLPASSGEYMIYGYVTRVFSDRVRYWYTGTPTWKHVA